MRNLTRPQEQALSLLHRAYTLYEGGGIVSGGNILILSELKNPIPFLYLLARGYAEFNSEVLVITSLGTEYVLAHNLDAG